MCRFVLLGMISVGSVIYFGLRRVRGASRRGGERLEYYLLLYVQYNVRNVRETAFRGKAVLREADGAGS